MVLRKNDDADRAFDLAEYLPGPYGRIVPGPVGVECEEQPGGVQIGNAVERADLWTGEGGAAGGDGGVLTFCGGVDGDGVEGAFDDDRPGSGGQRVAGFVQTEEQFALAEDRSLRAVEVLRPVRVDCGSAVACTIGYGPILQNTVKLPISGPPPIATTATTRR